MQTLDVREFSCAQRHARIFESFDALAVGESFEFVNDHKPTPLYHQFCQRYPDQFIGSIWNRGQKYGTWQYVELRQALLFNLQLTQVCQSNSLQEESRCRL